MTNDFEHKLVKHFEEDSRSFGGLNTKTDKLQEQMLLNGEHLSHFNKNIVELKNMVQEQTEINKAQSIRLEEHIRRVEPMLKSYEVNAQFNTVFGDRLKKWGGRITFTAAVLIAIVYLRSLLIKLL